MARAIKLRVKHCCRCNTVKPVSEFHKGNLNGITYEHGLAAYCKECVRAYMRRKQKPRKRRPRLTPEERAYILGHVRCP